ncbi:MAG: hypothetical protein GF331_27185, partial [Chitinivibrionales bacterium]|nr:hypothetical protein [Chitinivibrionales bacterium]
MKNDIQQHYRLCMPAKRKFRMAAGVVLLAFVCLAAAEVTFTVSPERTRTTLNQPIRVTAKLISSKDLGRVPAPSLPGSNDFKVLSVDRNQSSSSSINIVNGQAQRRTEITYLFHYTVAPVKLGTFTFPALKAFIGGKTYTTKPFMVEVLEQAVETANVIARVRCSKRSLYVGEQAVLTAEIGQKQGASVQLTTEGFRSYLTQLREAMGGSFSLVDLTSGKVGGREQLVNGERYIMYTVRYALLPLSSGSHAIPSATLQYNILRQTQRRRNDPFDDFFGSSFFGRSVQAQPATVLSNSLRLHVKPLPPAPDDFCGVVGEASLSADVSPRAIPAGEAVTLKVIVRGTTRPGSLAEVELPKLNGIEVFTPEKHTYADTSASGISTRRTYKYLLIPRSEGTARIPPITVSYFDVGAGEYKRLSTDEVELTVTEGSGEEGGGARYLSQAEIREVGRDIRFIKTAGRVHNQSRLPHRSPFLYLVNLLPFCIVLFAVLYRVQSVRRSRDPWRLERRRAASVARKELAALGRTKDLDNTSFVGRLHGVITGYLTRRFGFAASGQTNDELARALTERGADESLVQRLTAILETMD